MAAGWGGVVRVDLLDKIRGIPRDPQPSRRGRFRVGLALRSRWDFESETSVELQRSVHVAGHDANQIKPYVHGSSPFAPNRAYSRSLEFPTAQIGKQACDSGNMASTDV